MMSPQMKHYYKVKQDAEKHERLLKQMYEAKKRWRQKNRKYPGLTQKEIAELKRIDRCQTEQNHP